MSPLLPFLVREVVRTIRLAGSWLVKLTVSVAGGIHSDQSVIECSHSFKLCIMLLMLCYLCKEAVWAVRPNNGGKHTKRVQPGRNTVFNPTLPVTWRTSGLGVFEMVAFRRISLRTRLANLYLGVAGRESKAYNTLQEGRTRLKWIKRLQW